MFVAVTPDLKFRPLWLIVGYVLVVLVIYLSLTSKSLPMSGLFDYEDKFYHALAYFSLMTWFSQIYHGRKHRLIIALAFVFMGLMLEYLQSLNPNRYPEFADMIANMTGVVLGFAFTLRKARFLLLRFERSMF